MKSFHFAFTVCQYYQKSFLMVTFCVFVCALVCVFVPPTSLKRMSTDKFSPFYKWSLLCGFCLVCSARHDLHCPPRQSISFNFSSFCFLQRKVSDSFNLLQSSYQIKTWLFLFVNKALSSQRQYLWHCVTSCFTLTFRTRPRCDRYSLGLQFG